MQRIPLLILAQFAGIAFLPVLGGACSPSDSESENGGSSGAPGSAGKSTGGGASGGSTSAGTGGSAAGAATGGGGTSPGTAGTATGGGGAAATGGDGGQSNGGAAGAGGGASSGCATAAFCDEFERPMLGMDWLLEPGANTIAIDTTQHHSGMSSVHIKYGTGAMTTYFGSAKGLPFPNDTFWGRVWLYAMGPVKEGTTLEPGHHVYIEAYNLATKGASPSPSVRVLNTQKEGFLNTNTLGDKNATSTTVTLPQAKWSCFEWHIVSTGGKGSVELYLDGTTVPDTTQTDVSIPKVDNIRMGIRRYGPGVAGEIWYDDYAVGAERIGCD